MSSQKIDLSVTEWQYIKYPLIECKGRMMRKKCIQRLQPSLIQSLFWFASFLGIRQTMHILAGIVRPCQHRLPGWLSARKWQVVMPVREILPIQTAGFMSLLSCSDWNENETCLGGSYYPPETGCHFGLGKLLLVETGGTFLPGHMPGKIKTFTTILHWTLLGQILLLHSPDFHYLFWLWLFQRAVPIFKDTFKYGKYHWSKNLDYRYDHKSEDYIFKKTSRFTWNKEWLSLSVMAARKIDTMVRLIDGLWRPEVVILSFLEINWRLIMFGKNVS